MIKIMEEEFITDKEAANKYGYSLSWFQKQRAKGNPPPYFKLLNKGKVYYKKRELDEWFNENIFHHIGV